MRERLDALALGLATGAFVLRWADPGASGAGMTLFIHLLPWFALACWFAGRIRSGAVLKFTGMELAVLAFCLVGLLSVQRASYALPALELAFGFLSLGLLFLLAVTHLGRGVLLSLVFPALAAVSLYALLQVTLIFPALLEQLGGDASPSLLARIRSMEPYSTFTGPNQLAGFLVLLLPLAAGMAADDRLRNPRVFPVRLVVVLAAAVTLALTGSRGGWVALAAAALAFGALALTRNRRRGTAAALIVAAAALPAVLPFLGPAADRAGDLHLSVRVRTTYWRGARRTFAREPVLGVGLDNLQEYHDELKGETAEESKRAHHDALQLLADTGAVGLLAFLVLVGLAMRHGLAREASPASAPSPPPPWLPAAAAAALLPGLLRGAAGLELLALVMLVGLWIGLQVLLRGPDARIAAEPSPWTRIGAAAGLTGLLVHFSADFGLYVPGVATALFATMALVVLLRIRPAEARVPGPVCAALAAVLLLIAGPLLVLAVPRLLAAEAEAYEADRRLQAGDPDAVEAAAAARDHNPLDAEAVLLFSRATFAEWVRKSRESAVPGGVRDMQLRQLEGVVIEAAADALLLRPRHSPAHDWKARFHRAFRADCLRRAEAGDATARAMADHHGREALRHAETARALYPTHWAPAYLLARIHDDRGEPDRAAELYRETLRLDGLAAEARWGDDQRPSPVARARCLLRTGAEEEGLRIVRGHYERAFRNADPARARLVIERFLEEGRLPGVRDDEADALMRPVIESVLRDILGRLPTDG